MTRPVRGRVAGPWPRCLLPALLLALAAATHAFSPPTAPAATATTPVPPTIRHRLHASAPPIAARTAATSPWSAEAATTTSASRTPPGASATASATTAGASKTGRQGVAWPSPTASPRASSKMGTASTTTTTTTTLRPPTVGSRPTAGASANTSEPTTEPEVHTASQAERPSAAAATSATITASSAASATPGGATVRPADDEQDPMYAEYPDPSANLTSGSGADSVEGDVVPDPDAALRQDADEADERERASLADDGPVQMQGAVVVVPLQEDVVQEDVREQDLVAADGVAGALDADFEHAPSAVEPGEPELPVEVAADQDLREHDRLDGDAYRERERAELMLRNQGAAGKQVVIVGAALALVAQFLCLASATRRLRPGHLDVSTAVLFNVELALIVENLVFMLGVQSVGEPLRCQWVALALHYLHLVAAGWFLANTALLAYRLRCNAAPTTFRPVVVAVWLFPAVLVSAMYAAQPRSYETHRYCWMAVQRGMLLTFVAPVTLMITVNTALTLRGLRARPVAEDLDKDLAVDTEGGGVGGHQDGEAVRERDAATPAELRSSLRAAAAMLPLYSADWFLGVVAMDNSTFLTYPLLFLVSNGFLNWFLMVCAWLVVPRESHKEGGDWCGGGDGEDLDDEDELLLEEDEAGCWGKGGGYGTAYGAALGGPGEEQALIWAANAERTNGLSAEPRVHVRPPARSTASSRWDETFLRDGEAAAREPQAVSSSAALLSQELAEMRYDGGISTISS